MIARSQQPRNSTATTTLCQLREDSENEPLHYDYTSGVTSESEDDYEGELFVVTTARESFIELEQSEESGEDGTPPAKPLPKSGARRLAPFKAVQKAKSTRASTSVAKPLTSKASNASAAAKKSRFESDEDAGDEEEEDEIPKPRKKYKRVTVEAESDSDEA